MDKYYKRKRTGSPGKKKIKGNKKSQMTTRIIIRELTGTLLRYLPKIETHQEIYRKSHISCKGAVKMAAMKPETNIFCDSIVFMFMLFCELLKVGYRKYLVNRLSLLDNLRAAAPDICT